MSSPAPPTGVTLAGVAIKGGETTEQENTTTTTANTVHEESKKHIEELEQINEELYMKITRAKRTIERLRLERRILLEKLESVDEGGEAGIQAEEKQNEDSGDDYDTESEKHKRKKVIKKRKPSNPFFLYAQQKREEIKATKPELSKADVGKLLGNNWKQMSEEDKKEYYKAFEKQQHLLPADAPLVTRPTSENEFLDDLM